jgi:hypothetical protein
VPKVSEFFGISIYLYFREHPPPHFHARYAEEEVLVSIEDLNVLAGRINPRALGLVIEWAALHQDDLRRSWQQAQAHETPDRIEPLR